MFVHLYLTVVFHALYLRQVGRARPTGRRHTREHIICWISSHRLVILFETQTLNTAQQLVGVDGIFWFCRLMLLLPLDNAIALSQSALAPFFRAMRAVLGLKQRQPESTS